MRPVWIHSALVDVGLLGFSWLPIFAFSLFVYFTGDGPACDLIGFRDCSPLMISVYAFSLYAIRIHRHYTIGMVYGDPVELARRRRVYIWVPVLLLVAMLPFILSGFFPQPWRRYLYLGLVTIAAPSAVWNVYHIILQKYGVLRAYAVKLGYGDPRLERRMFLAWSVALVGGVLVKYDDMLIKQVSLSHSVDMAFVEPLRAYVPYLAWLSAIPAIYYTARFIAQELRSFSPANVPKLIFAASVALMLSTFFHSLLVGYMVFGFSHSIEYIAFVNLYGARRPSVASWVRNRWLMNGLWIVGVTAIYLAFERLPTTYEASTALVFGYTTYNSYLHFLFDGYIWRMRDPAVSGVVSRMAEPVTG